MKAILKYDLPEEQSQFTDAVNGNAWKTVCEEMRVHLRGKLKHGIISNDAIAALEEAQTVLFDALRAEGLEL